MALLLFHKADVTLRDKQGYTPLILAQINRRIDSVEMIQNEIELRQQVRQETEKSNDRIDRNGLTFLISFRITRCMFRR